MRFFEKKKTVENFKFHSNLTIIKGTAPADRYVYIVTVSRSVLLKMKNIPDKSCTENQNTFYFQYFLFENRSVCE